MKTRDFNVLFSFYPYHQDNYSYPFSNLILNQIQNSKKIMNLSRTLFPVRNETLAL